MILDSPQMQTVNTPLASPGNSGPTNSKQNLAANVTCKDTKELIDVSSNRRTKSSMHGTFRQAKNFPTLVFKT